jgi:ribonuclease PH
MKVKRIDGRKEGQMRPVEIEPGYLRNAEGSALISVGGTRVICAASVEEKVPHFMRGKGSGWVTAEYAMLPRSTHTRTPRESSKGKVGGRTHEIKRLIGRSLRAVTDMEALGERTVWIDCDVIEADGGTRTASITGAFVALCLALEKIRGEGLIDTIPVRDHLAAISVGVVEGEILLDLCYDEDSRADVDMNVVMTGGGKIVEIQGTAEKEPFSWNRLETMTHLAKKGIADLVGVQKKVLGRGIALGEKG